MRKKEIIFGLLSFIALGTVLAGCGSSSASSKDTVDCKFNPNFWTNCSA